MNIKVTRIPNILGGWVTRLFRSSHLPPAEKCSRCGVGSRWLTIIVWQVSYVQYLLACPKLQRSTPYNIVKNGLPGKQVFHRHLPPMAHRDDGKKPASRHDLLPSRLQRMRRFCQIRLSLSIPTHMQVMWSKYGECLFPIHGVIRPRSCLPGNASVLGCPNLEIPASDDQRCSAVRRLL